MATYEVMERPWEIDGVPAAVVTDYSAARKLVAAKGEKFAMRERLTSLKQRAFFAEVYAFRFNEHGGWANFTLCEETGELSIQSDWGDWQYMWPQPGRGKGTLKSFIASAGTCYLAGKLTREREKEFCADASIAKIKADEGVISLLLEKPELGDAINSLSEFGSCEAFMMYLYKEDDLEEVRDALGSDMHEIVPVYKDKGSYLFLRDSLLVFFQRFLRETAGG